MKGSELIWYWADCMTLPFDHTHDLDLGVSRSESEIALSQNGVVDWQWTKRMWVIHDIDLCDHGEWADVPDSDRGDFRRRHAVDISSFAGSLKFQTQVQCKNNIFSPSLDLDTCDFLQNPSHHLFHYPECLILSTWNNAYPLIICCKKVYEWYLLVSTPFSIFGLQYTHNHYIIEYQKYIVDAGIYGVY